MVNFLKRKYILNINLECLTVYKARNESNFFTLEKILFHQLDTVTVESSC